LGIACEDNILSSDMKRILTRIFIDIYQIQQAVASKFLIENTWRQLRFEDWRLKIEDWRLEIFEL